MSQQSYSDLERGESKSTSKIGSLARALKVDAFWLETGEGPRLPDRIGEDPAFYLPEDKRQLMDAYDALSAQRKRALLVLISEGG